MTLVRLEVIHEGPVRVYRRNCRSIQKLPAAEAVCAICGCPFVVARWMCTRRRRDGRTHELCSRRCARIWAWQHRRDRQMVGVVESARSRTFNAMRRKVFAMVQRLNARDLFLFQNERREIAHVLAHAHRSIYACGYHAGYARRTTSRAAPLSSRTMKPKILAMVQRLNACELFLSPNERREVIQILAREYQAIYTEAYGAGFRRASYTGYTRRPIRKRTNAI
jgi:hypothetical protein